MVYDRAPTKFKWCDARRIARSLPSPDPFSTEMGCFLHSVDMLLEHLPDEILAENVDFGPDFAISGLQARQTLEIAIAQAWDDFPGFAGGEFGGGGASREVPSVPNTGGTSRPGGNPFEIGPCGVPYLVMPLQAHCL